MPFLQHIRVSTAGFVAALTTPEEFDRIVRADITTFARVGKQVGLIAKQDLSCLVPFRPPNEKGPSCVLGPLRSVAGSPGLD